MDDATTPAPDTARRLPAAVLWDMDGTLIDTEPSWARHETALVESFGGTWTHDDMLACVGNPLEVSARYIRETTPVDLPEREITVRMQAGVMADMRDRMPWRPRAAELLAALGKAGVPCALVTMSWRPMVDVLLEALPEGTFATVVTGDVVERGKPDPEAYLTAIAELGVEAAECVALEDSRSGVGAALASGARTVAVPHLVEIPDAPGLAKVPTLAGVAPGDLWRLSQA
ncbi:HAD family hydrolase [Mobilicoccus pelagius]|uniref:Putative hydrolase n=1 Tax=Mobilicoccus pelagius NBRC 104925 TaxID=1089455 RepID=H5UTH0_9MICO|nr:HAD family phosphatase [Mobilicoccus pelagius]GAB49028.1 putative hydrolase [Mobilicoccus pelagius NBRC 104925]